MKTSILLFALLFALQVAVVIPGLIALRDHIITLEIRTAHLCPHGLPGPTDLVKLTPAGCMP